MMPADPRVNYTFDPTEAAPRTFTALEEAKAEAFCTKAITESVAASACMALGVDVQRFIASCTGDLLFQNDEALVDGSVCCLSIRVP